MADSVEPCEMLWANPCCHGNEIWVMHGDPVAYRHVFNFSTVFSRRIFIICTDGFPCRASYRFGFNMFARFSYWLQ